MNKDMPSKKSKRKNPFAKAGAKKPTEEAIEMMGQPFKPKRTRKPKAP